MALGWPWSHPGPPIADWPTAVDGHLACVSSDGARLAVSWSAAWTTGIGPGVPINPTALKILDATAGRELRSLPIPKSVQFFEFSSDGTRLVGYGFRANAAYVWDV